VYTEYLVYKVLTQKGAEGWGSVSVDWEPWHQERPTIKVRVITPDYVVHELDLRTVTDAPVEDDDADIYSDRRVIRAPLPAIAPGSVVEQEIAIRDTAPLFAAGVVERVFFGRVSTPVQHESLTLQAPSSVPMRYSPQLLPGLEPQRSESGGTVKLVFEHGPMDPLDEADTNLPSDVPAYPAIAFSTGISWQQVAEEYATTVDQRLSTADLKGLAEKLTRGKSSRNEKAQAILEYLDKYIRYTGVEFGEASIVPHSPTETLAHRYGDCKDKSTLLVGLLRAAGVPANIALLRAGGRQDVPSDLPGMGIFDHAIVYVPGEPDLWIDATDDYARVGQLPMADQDRLTLIARAESTVLVRTTQSSSQENALLELRQIYLAENGPARIVETSRPRGVFESEYRDAYADKQNKKTRENLTEYVKSQYLAEKLDRLDRTDPDNLTQQFELVLETNKARRGYTDLDSAVAAIRIENLFSRLPDELQKRADEESKQQDGAKPKKNRVADYQLPQPHVAEWQYEIAPPVGFHPKSLPHDVKLSIGPATLTEHFEAEKSGVVRAAIRLDTVKRRFTVPEATELRNRIADLKAGEAITINFEPTGRVLQDQGKWRESLQTYRELISQHPKEALHHLQIAKALLDAGMGEAARKEAGIAVKLEPKSALAEKTLAEILEYDVVGRQFRPGSDYRGAAMAFREAVKLDPDDKSTQGDLAILLEYNDDGVRYGAGANLKEAITTYRTLGPEKLASIGLGGNLAFTLFYAGQFENSEQNAETLNPQPKALITACEAIKNGTQSALSEANKRSSGDDLKQNLKAAGEMLMNVRKYSVAADLMQAGASGSNTAATVGLASILRKAQLHEEIQFAKTPRDLVRQFFLVSLQPDLTLERLRTLTSKNALIAIKNTDPEELKKTLSAGKLLRRNLARQGSSLDVTLDILMVMADPKEEGNDRTGYRERLHLPNAKMTLYVVREDDGYKLLDTSEKPNSIALEVLDRIGANDLAGAATLLNWIRDEQHIEGGDDPLAGAAFPRLWSKRAEADTEQMKIAAAAIMVQTKSLAKQGVAILEDAKKSASASADRTSINLALLNGYSNLEDYTDELAVASELAEQYPDSRRIFFARCFDLRRLGRADEADKLAQDRLKATPDDVDAMRALVMNAVAKEDYQTAYDRNKTIVNAAKAEASDLNGMAWQSLFFERAEGPDIETAVKASQLSSNNAAILHTLGCLYTEKGQVKQAREVLVHAMDILGLDEPNADYWYALGRIAEQYGENDIAVTDYARVDKPKSSFQIPDSTYVLAQNRLRSMKLKNAVREAQLTSRESSQ